MNLGQRGARLVAALWLVAAVVATPAALELSGMAHDDDRTTRAAGAESTRALRPTTDVVVAYERAGGLTAADRAEVAAAATAFGALGTVAGPFPADDGAAAETVVSLDLGGGDWARADRAVGRLRSMATGVQRQTDRSAEQSDGTPPLTVSIGGPGARAAEAHAALRGADRRMLWISILFGALVFLVATRSAALWLASVGTSLVALVVARGAVGLVAHFGGLRLDTMTVILTTVLVLGATVRAGVAGLRPDPGKATGTLAAVPALLCLRLAQIAEVRDLGTAAALGVGVAVAVTLTLQPVLRRAIAANEPDHRPAGAANGPRAGSGVRAAPANRARGVRGIGLRSFVVPVVRAVIRFVAGRRPGAARDSGGVRAGVAGWVAGRARPVAFLAAGGLLLLALGGFAARPGGAPGAPEVRGAVDSARAGAILARHFGAGQGSPVTIVTSAGGAAPAHLAAMATSGVVPATVTRPQTFSGYSYAQATLTSGPDSVAAMDTVDRLRAAIDAVAGAGALVGGDTATVLDTRDAAVEDRGAVVPAMLMVFCAVLGFALRSWTVPLAVAAGAVLVFGAAFGVSAPFLHGMDPSLPTLLFALLLASTVDGSTTPLSRVRAAVRGTTARRSPAWAIRTGLAGTAATGTATALLTAGTGAVLATLPVVTLAQLGAALSAGAMLDLLVVRSLLVPALVVYIGRRTGPAPRVSRVRHTALQSALRSLAGRRSAPPADAPV